MEKHIRTHRVRSEDGSILEVDEYQEFIDVTTISDTAIQWAPGMKRLELSDGGAVNYLDDSTFQIVATGEKLAVL